MMAWRFSTRASVATVLSSPHVFLAVHGLNVNGFHSWNYNKKYGLRVSSNAIISKQKATGIGNTYS